MFFGKLKYSTCYGFDICEERFESCLEIDDDLHISLIEEANNQGKLISADKDGKPVLIDPPKPSEEQLAEDRVIKLKDYLSETDWYAIRFADTGEVIPADIKKKRQEARDEISRLRGIIN